MRPPLVEICTNAKVIPEVPAAREGGIPDGSEARDVVEPRVVAACDDSAAGIRSEASAKLCHDMKVVRKPSYSSGCPELVLIDQEILCFFRRWF